MLWKRKSYFPFHFLVGPDWPIVVLVYGMIISIDTVVLAVVSPLGWPPVLIGIFGSCCLLYSYSAVVFSDPGIVFKNNSPGQSLTDSDIEGNSSVDGVDPKLNSPLTSDRNSQLIRRVPDTVECGHCEFQRPYSARHCHYCKVCIDDLDHHCPWYDPLTLLRCLYPTLTRLAISGAGNVSARRI